MMRPEDNQWLNLTEVPHYTLPTKAPTNVVCCQCDRHWQRGEWVATTESGWKCLTECQVART